MHFSPKTAKRWLLQQHQQQQQQLRLLQAGNNNNLGITPKSSRQTGPLNKYVITFLPYFGPPLLPNVPIS
jgi:hypothetical protein